MGRMWECDIGERRFQAEGVAQTKTLAGLGYPEYLQYGPSRGICLGGKECFVTNIA